MANLTDTLVNGDLRVTGNIYGNTTGTLTGNSTSSTYPAGFSSRKTSITWGVLKDQTLVTDWGTSNSAEIAFAQTGGALSVQIDGTFYQNEGTYAVLDTSSSLDAGKITGQVALANGGTGASDAATARTNLGISSTSTSVTIGDNTISQYVHPSSGVTAGTYRSVTVDAAGHVTAGTNPTTLSGYGITDAKIANGVITLGSNTITPLTSYVDTKNTAGSTDTTSKIYLIGATSQAANPQTYSDSEVYVQNGTMYLAKTQDASGSSDSRPALIVGDIAGTHIEFDPNEIMAKASGTTTGSLYINNDGGSVYVNNTLVAKGASKGSASIPVYTDSSGTVTACTDDFVHDGDIASTYDAEGTSAVNGTAVAQAISTKQDSLSTQTAYISKGSATQVPQITTNTLGQVTSISEVTITDTNYYPTEFAWTDGTTEGPTGSLTVTGTEAVSFGAIPSASSTASGIVTTGDQTFAGIKSFSTTAVINPGAAASYNEGLRINLANDGWSELTLGGAASSTSGVTGGAWIVARRGKAGSIKGSTGDFTIEYATDTGSGLTLFTSGGGYLNGAFEANGQVKGTTFNINSAATMQYNSTDKCVEFVF